MTPDALRATIAAARLRPRVYGATTGDLASYLHGLVAGAYDGCRDVPEVWSALHDPPLRPGVYPDATSDSVCDHALRVADALWPQDGKVTADEALRAVEEHGAGEVDAGVVGALADEVKRLRAVVAAVRREHDARAAWLASLPSGACSSPPPRALLDAEAATRAALQGVP